MALIRLDKYLCDMLGKTRSQVKETIRKGQVLVNENLVKKPETKVDLEKDIVKVNGEELRYVEYEYYMLNKPAGVISATSDDKEKTVVDLIADKKRKDLFPMGRLDKDTEGLLIITNDGQLSHKLLSPRNHVPKTYFAITQGEISENAVIQFKEGMTLEDGTKVKPAILKILSSKDDKTTIELTIYEGKFHQVKRMVEAVGSKVIFLKRLSMGKLQLDPKLSPGEYRSLTSEEIDILRGQEDV